MDFVENNILVRSYIGGRVLMKIVVVKMPKFFGNILKKVFKIG
jgi:hypothetical protein